MEGRRLEECVRIAAEAARHGGAVLQDWQRRFSVREKGRFDLVTDADLAAQEAIHAYLHARFPDFRFLGEEASETVQLTPGQPGQPTWIVDPLDGTTNYVHGLPIYAVSIGLEVAGRLVLGVVFDPSRDELFHAACGLGAWLNGQQLQTTRVQRLEEALLSTGFPPDLQGQEHTLATWHYFSLRTQSLRRTGSTALNLAYVAAGRNDGFWTYLAHPWDAAAGVVLVREAGGQVSKLNGEAYDLRRLEVLASNGPLHPVLLAGFRTLAIP